MKPPPQESATFEHAPAARADSVTNEEFLPDGAAPQSHDGTIAFLRKDWQSRSGAYTYRYHRIYAACDGAIQGILYGPAFSFIVLKALGNESIDQETYSVLLQWLPTLATLSAPMWGVGGRGSRWYWPFAALMARIVPCIILALAFEPLHALIGIIMIAIFGSGIPPLQNTLFGRNYMPSERDRYHGKTKLYHIPAFVATNVGLMVWLDHWPDAFRVMYPIAALFGAAGLLVIWRARMKRVKGDPVGALEATKTRLRINPLRVPTILGSRFVDTIKLFARDRDFLIYEIGFMLYGTAFMMLLPVIPLYYQHRFAFDYTQFGVFSVVAFKVVVLTGHIVLKGRTGQWSAQRTAGTAFLILMGYPFMLLISSLSGLAWLGIFGFMIYGAGMVLVDYAWNFGPLRFARNGDPMPYLSAHTMLVGLRGLYAFPLSLMLMKYASSHNGADPISQWILDHTPFITVEPGVSYYVLSLIVPILLLFLASLTLWFLNRRLVRRGDTALLGARARIGRL